MKKVNSVKQLKEIAKIIRQDIIRMISNAGSGHPGGSLGMADVFTALYFNVLNHKPKNPSWSDRDRLVLSNGHICPVRYAAMARAGYFPVKELMTLRKLGTRLQGHPSRLDLSGLESSSGSLGHGLSISVGMALAGKMDKKKHKIYCIVSDGELDEGSSWEAVNAASKYRLDNLIAIVDRNYIQIDGYTEKVWPLDSLDRKFLAFNWNVIKIDGNKMDAVLSAFKKAKKVKSKPTVIIAKIIPGKGVSFMENKYGWHGKAPNKEEAEIALKELK